MINIGDRVRMKESLSWLYKGDEGIVLIRNSYKSLGVRWDRKGSGHDLDGKCENGHGWFIPSSYIIRTGIDSWKNRMKTFGMKQSKHL